MRSKAKQTLRITLEDGVDVNDFRAKSPCAAVQAWRSASLAGSCSFSIMKYNDTE